MGILDSIKKRGAKKTDETTSTTSAADTQQQDAPSKEVAASSKDVQTDAPKQANQPMAQAATGDYHQILIQPIVTEKAASLSAVNQYVFMVAPDATKNEIKKAIERIYGIKPVRVNVSTVRGKKVRYGRVFGQRKNWRKAVVTLPAGQSIQIYEGV